jgi:signal recognition particle receptor subunit beta
MEHKIVFTGPVGAGKTTAIGAVSDIPVVSTEALATDEVAKRKAKTTVAMDYGALNLGQANKVHLYGTPGQERFNFMWEILAAGGIGLVLLIDNTRPDPLADLDFYIKAFRSFIEQSGGAVVVGVTRMDVKPRPGLYSFHTALATLGLKVPVFEVDARQREDVKRLLLGLLAVLDPSTKRRA